MGVEEIQPHASKFPRTANGTGRRSGTSELVQAMGSSQIQYPKLREEGPGKRKGSRRGGATVSGTDESGREGGWRHTSRIVRVSRASGGKDRHSKVLTSKGLRDRRVRLSVPTAIQFYDIQDRLGYNQPSKAVEWLINAAGDSISELPSLKECFPGSSPMGKQSVTGDEKPPENHGFDSDDDVPDGNLDPNSHYCPQNQNISLAKSAYSSAPETSKGTASLPSSGSELHNNRVGDKHNRLRERIAEENKDISCNHRPLNLISQSPSFTELLMGGIGKSNTMNATTASTGTLGSNHQDSCNSTRQWSPAPMDYFTRGSLRNSSRFTDQLRMANNQIPLALPITPFAISSGNNGGNHHAQHSVVHEGFIQVAATASSTGAENNLNFMTPSSSTGEPSTGGLVGFDRETLQSNSPLQQQSLLSHLQGQSLPNQQTIRVPFFIGTATPLDNHNNNQFFPRFDGRLQLYHGHGAKEEPRK
ncbi:hypothetical protein MLD38_016684 [Melastoma candidum]|uniref:Uncharacterized protein n=1 Tax=Melastoma candidum TaxID=119954 RepID=A0ACB9QML4_9MYRT|nr:hypothetical protein MLD38_016684 [Melastoma candidum]